MRWWNVFPQTTHSDTFAVVISHHSTPIHTTHLPSLSIIQKEEHFNSTIEQEQEQEEKNSYQRIGYCLLKNLFRSMSTRIS
jgi:hypothetical protein